MILRALALASVLLAGAAAAQPPASPPAGMQWLYGSGEGAASSLQAYRGFRNFVLARARARPRHSVVLAEGSTLAALAARTDPLTFLPAAGWYGPGPRS